MVSFVQCLDYVNVYTMLQHSLQHTSFPPKLLVPYRLLLP